MLKYRTFPSPNIALITKHILKQRQGKFFISNRRQFQFNNFIIKFHLDFTEIDKQLVVAINKSIKEDKLRTAAKYTR